jgi:hypothetical protein
MLQSYNPYLALEEDAVLVDAIGEPLVRTHVAVVHRQRWRGNFRRKRWRSRRRSLTEGSWGLSFRTLNVPTLDVHGQKGGATG